MISIEVRAMLNSYPAGLNPEVFSLENSVDPDQMASDEAI